MVIDDIRLRDQERQTKRKKQKQRRVAGAVGEVRETRA